MVLTLSIAKVKLTRGVENDVDLSTEDLKLVVELFKRVYNDNGLEFPEKPMTQLSLAINAVFDSVMLGAAQYCHPHAITQTSFQSARHNDTAHDLPSALHAT